MHDICNLFGVALNRARHELGLTQVELAEKLGTTDRSISDLERGKTNPKLDTVAHFARSLEISVDALIGVIECLLFLLWTLAYFDLSPIPQSPFGLQLIAILILILSTVILLFYIRKKNKR